MQDPRLNRLSVRRLKTGQICYIECDDNLHRVLRFICGRHAYLRQHGQSLPAFQRTAVPGMRVGVSENIDPLVEALRLCSLPGVDVEGSVEESFAQAEREQRYFVLPTLGFAAIAPHIRVVAPDSEPGLLVEANEGTLWFSPCWTDQHGKLVNAGHFYGYKERDVPAVPPNMRNWELQIPFAKDEVLRKLPFRIVVWKHLLGFMGQRVLVKSYDIAAEHQGTAVRILVPTELPSRAEASKHFNVPFFESVVVFNGNGIAYEEVSVEPVLVEGEPWKLEDARS